VIATTHYSGLKMYAGNEEGVINASVEFDEKTLRPTYRLLVGVAGASSGLEIAAAFGVPSSIVERGGQFRKDSSLQASEYLNESSVKLKTRKLSAARWKKSERLCREVCLVR
jgi:DNA mismatch repair protein MutS2